MASKHRPRSEAESKQQSEEWKLQGNDAFKVKDFSTALSCYTQAISLHPSNHVLYSNRSGAYLSLEQLPLALDDANRAIELAPKWAKAYRRKACVLDAQKRHREAKEVYQEALKIVQEDAAMASATKAKEIGEMERLIAGLEKKIYLVEVVHPGSLMPSRDEKSMPGFLVLREAERRMKAGEPFGKWPPVGSCKRRLLIAEMQFHHARTHLREFQVRRTNELPPGAPPGAEIIFGRLQTLEELTTAMIEDIRVARFEESDLDKISLVYKLEQQQRDAVGPRFSPKQTVLEYARRLNSPAANDPSDQTAGWDHVRPALQLSIRSRVMNGFLESKFDSIANGVEQFREAVQLIEEARKMWPTVDGSIRGRSLEETFLRGVKVALGHAMIQDYYKNIHPDPSISNESKRSHLQEIIDLGTWLVASFERSSQPPEEAHGAAMDAWWSVYYHHYVHPKAHGHLLIAFGNLNMATTLDTFQLHAKDGRAGPIASDPVKLGIAATNYAKAAAWMPPDCPDRPNFLWYALLATIHRGVFYLGDAELIRDMALKGTTFFTPYFPPSIIPESHAGKMAYQELQNTSGDQPGAAIISPLVHWPDDVATDIPLLNEVMHEYIKNIMHDQEQGLLVIQNTKITEVIRDTWRERVEVYGEPKDAVGAEEIWTALDPNLRDGWEKMLQFMGEVVKDKQTYFFGGWNPPEMY